MDNQIQVREDNQVVDNRHEGETHCYLPGDTLGSHHVQGKPLDTPDIKPFTPEWNHEQNKNPESTDQLK